MPDYRSQSRLSILSFWRIFTFRHARNEWMQTLLLTAILGLGVGTFLSIRIANRAAVEGFRLFTERVRGSSDWIMESPGGGLPVSELSRIRRTLGSLPADIYPVVEATLQKWPGSSGEALASPQPVRLLGLDLVQIRELAESSTAADDGEFWDSLDDPEHLLIGPELKTLWKTQIDESLSLVLRGEVTSFTVRAILPEERRDGTPIPKNVAIVDLGALQRRLPGLTLDRVEIVIPDGAFREETIRAVKERLIAAYGGIYRLSSPSDQSLQGASMTAAFRLNLTVLSLIALLVGIYLIAQTLDATVSRRRKEIATLRSLGVGPGEIYRLWLSEAILYGILAGFAGILVGWGLSFLTIDAVTTTVRSLYRDTLDSAASLTWEDILLSFFLGISGSLLAAWLPAKDAASTPPAQFLRLGKRIPPFPLFNHTWLGLLAVVSGGALLSLPPLRATPHLSIPVGGYACSFLWLVGGTLLVVRLLNGAGLALTRWLPHSPVARLAAGRLIHPTSRHQLALAGFFIAIGMAGAISFLIGSFEHTVTSWLKHRLRADIFISTIGFQGADRDERIPAHILDAMEADPEIAAMDRFRQIPLDLNGLSIGLGGMRTDLLGNQQNFLWIEAPQSLSAPPGTVPGYANENLARRAPLKVGDTLTIPTPKGDQIIFIAAIHADYSRDNGSLIVDLRFLKDWFSIDAYDTASLFLKDGISPLAKKEQLRAAYPGLAVRDNPELMSTALNIFDQTFAVTKALQLIGILVALSGLVLSLVSLLRESEQELSLQKTLGMTRHQIALSSAIEGFGIAACGLLGGTLLSTALGGVMIFVINRQSFGWTLQTAYPLALTVLLSLLMLLLSWAISYATGALFLRKWKPQPL